jgi:SAM-dependent methyltransferase
VRQTTSHENTGEAGANAQLESKEPMISNAVSLPTSAERARLGVYAERFVELVMDPEWTAAVQDLKRARHGRLRTYAQRLARLYLSDFDANALTGMYRMQLLPTSGWRALLASRAGGTLLDVGAGSGDVTRALAPCFDRVEATEVSRGMRKRLAAQGFTCHALDLSEAPLEGGPFDAVALLNVLDRCRRPRRLLQHALQALRSGGTLIVALALPYRPFYFDGPTTPEPLERLDCDAGPGSRWEDGARRLLERDLLPLGLQLERFARVPYLSAGDSERPLYALDDVVAILSKR